MPTRGSLGTHMHWWGATQAMKGFLLPVSFLSCPFLASLLLVLNFPYDFPIHLLNTINHDLQLCLIQTLCLHLSSSTPQNPHRRSLPLHRLFLMWAGPRHTSDVTWTSTTFSHLSHSDLYGSIGQFTLYEYGGTLVQRTARKKGNLWVEKMSNLNLGKICALDRTFPRSKRF